MFCPRGRKVRFKSVYDKVMGEIYDEEGNVKDGTQNGTMRLSFRFLFSFFSIIIVWMGIRRTIFHYCLPASLSLQPVVDGTITLISSQNYVVVIGDVNGQALECHIAF